VHWSVDDPYERIRERQRELRERAEAARLAADARRGAMVRSAAPGRLSRAARLLRTTLARP
jgi:hypothetical protein